MEISKRNKKWHRNLKVKLFIIAEAAVAGICYLVKEAYETGEQNATEQVGGAFLRYLDGSENGEDINLLVDTYRLCKERKVFARTNKSKEDDGVQV